MATPKVLKQGQQMGVGAFVEHQKTGVHPKVDDLPLGIGQAHVHGVRVAAKVIARLQQGDVGVAVQTVWQRPSRQCPNPQWPRGVAARGWVCEKWQTNL